MQEYFLGRLENEELEKTKAKIAADFSNADFKSQLPTKRVEGVTMPALQLNMSDGTQCDLNGRPRSTRVLYVCDLRGNHEIYSLEEVSTCEYEIVVLSPLLCQHPDFKSKETGENLINCHPLPGSPTTPKALLEMETESFKMRHEHLLQNLESLLDTKLKAEVKPIEGLTDDEKDMLKIPKTSYQDQNFLAGFLSGKNCLTGGSHWWKFEFCYGKYVLQYHEQEGGSRTEIMLGKWDEQKHKEWLEKNPQKKPTFTQLRKNLVHYYSGGATCGDSGIPRSVEVKFRCVESPSSSSVAVYLLEPNTCEYALSVESSLFCPFLKSADEFGLFDMSEFEGRKSPDKKKSL
jgi:endoplasmic reticulum lectin 1